MTPLATLSGRFERLSGRLLLFAPVCLGLGVGAYFALPVEPGALAWVVIMAVCAGLVAAAARLRHTRYIGLGFAAAGLALVFAGLLLGGLRTEIVRAPILAFHYYGPVEGRIVKVDRSGSGAPRLTLDALRLDRVAPHERPERVRVSLLGTQGYLTPEPGQRVAMTAYLFAPEGPVAPGGFDFRRMAWFDRLGAVGSTQSPALLLAPAEGGLGALAIQRLRARIGAGVRAALPGAPGAFAAAITTGDRSAMDPAALDALRGANLAHLLAISGLHMGLLTGFVFAAMRYILALIPRFADRFPTRKIAAVVALQAGAFYLALSGGSVATERAFIMVSVMFGAVLMERRALTLRAVAIAALLILCLQPESLTEPGFQMSFSATTALVLAFGLLRMWRGPRPPRWLRPATAVLISSAVAGLATAPFAAAHFNQVSYYGLLANLLAVPVMGTLVMPLAVLAALLAPFGAHGLALWAMSFPIRWILAVADWVTGLDGAVGQVPTPPALVLPLIALGGVAGALAVGRWRLVGVLSVALALGVWADAQRPDVLIAPNGGLVGVMTRAGRVLSKPRGEGFAARVWLEDDGDPATQAEAAARPGFSGPNSARETLWNGLRLVHLTGKSAPERVAEACARADIVVTTAEVTEPRPGCALFDATRLNVTGALALWTRGAGYEIVSVADVSGDRPWTRPRGGWR